MADYSVSTDPNWQPYRDPKTGEVVTLSEGQCAAVLRAFSVYWHVVKSEQDKGTKVNPAFDPDAIAPLRTVTKSRLMGRLLHDGKAPLVDAPPIEWSGPDYSVETT